MAKCDDLETDFRDLMAVAQHLECLCEEGPDTYGYSALSTWSFIHYLTNSQGGESDEALSQFFNERQNKRYLIRWQLPVPTDGIATLLELLEWTSDFAATDPRDKIFTLLGIAYEGTDHAYSLYPKVGFGTNRRLEKLFYPRYLFAHSYLFIGETYLHDLDLMWGMTVDEVKKGKSKIKMKSYTLR